MDAQQALEYFLPYLKIFNFLGLFPLGKKIQFKIQIYVVILLLILYYYYNHHVIASDHEFMENFNDAIQLFVAYLCIFVVYAETAFTRKRIIRFFKVFGDVNKSFTDLNVQTVKYYEQFINQYKFYFLFLILITLSMEIVIISTIQKDKQWVSFWWVSILPMLLNRMRQLQLSLFLGILVLHLGILSDLLKVNGSLKSCNKLKSRIRVLKFVYILIYREFESFHLVFQVSLAFEMFQHFVELLSGTYWLYYYHLNDHYVLGE